MLSVLKATPGVRDPNLGISSYDGWTHPFLEYRADEKSHWVQPTRFYAQKPHDPDRGPYPFVGVLPGIGTLDLHVTNSVIKSWEAECGVHAIALLA
jgi:hypothetical protein